MMKMEVVLNKVMSARRRALKSLAVMSLSRFTVSVTEQSSSSTFRTTRRAILNADTLKNLKLTTGDVVAVFKSEEPLKVCK